MPLRKSSPATLPHGSINLGFPCLEPLSLLPSLSVELVCPEDDLRVWRLVRDESLVSTLLLLSNTLRPFSRRVARITDALTYLVTKAAERGDTINVATFNIDASTLCIFNLAHLYKFSNQQQGAFTYLRNGEIL